MHNDPDLRRAQYEVARRQAVTPVYVDWDLKVGAARNLRTAEWPVNGLRHPPQLGTTGWYLWAGETLPDDPDFFVPLHAQHLPDWRPEVLPYLALPPGWRFLIAPGYEDVWEDRSLLEVE